MSGLCNFSQAFERATDAMNRGHLDRYVRKPAPSAPLSPESHTRRPTSGGVRGRRVSVSPHDMEVMTFLPQESRSPGGFLVSWP